ncbi:MCE family protein [Kutzneria buriramensis]|uniref:Phospholipid/cholesterol/gamma-HCH transport system substrate-binding protein n=1 Tax=Kutzneria buriramensis TaxID=1045776 RepID=A0A3E0GT96_9PSEU|nr:MCE family protein [Kutzneria buriramensis]REH26464.1 phospholipid/cholesterol/gamma-HCH transport system substrate-binding protein [Kutzneria buriramensis]
MRATLVKSVVFVVVTGVATGALGVAIANPGSGDTAEYSARFSNAIALSVGDDVRIAGVKVGQVDRISVAEQRVAEVEFSVERDHPLPASVTAAIKYRNLVGQRYIALGEGAGDPNQMLPPGGRIPLARTSPALDLTALLNGFKPVLRALSPGDVNQMAGEIVQVLQGEGGTVDDLLAHTASLTSTLAQRDQVIGEVIDHLNSVLAQVNTHDDQLSTLVTTTQQLVSGLSADRGAIGDAVSGLAGLADATTNLLQQGRQPLKDDIAQLGGVAANLAANEGLVDQFLTNLPAKLDAIGRTASYGSWLNFYLCGATTDAPAPPGGATPGIPVTAGRCK